MRKISTLIAWATLLFLALALLGVYWSIRQTPPAALTGNTPTPLSTFKDLFLVAASGILTLCSAYLGAFIQSFLQQQEKRREERRETTKSYKEYLLKTMQIGQLARIIKDEKGLKEFLPQNGKKYEITSTTIDQVLGGMPLWWGYSSLSDQKTKDAVFKAMYASIEDLMNLYSGNETNPASVEQKYLEALAALEEYERM